MFIEKKCFEEGIKDFISKNIGDIITKEMIVTIYHYNNLPRNNYIL